LGNRSKDVLDHILLIQEQIDVLKNPERLDGSWCKI